MDAWNKARGKGVGSKFENVDCNYDLLSIIVGEFNECVKISLHVERKMKNKKNGRKKADKKKKENKRKIKIKSSW